MELLRNEVEKHEENRRNLIATLDEERKQKMRLAQTQRIEQTEMLKQEKKLLLDQRHEMQMQVGWDVLRY